jgi:hypothetical protein
MSHDVSRARASRPAGDSGLHRLADEDLIQLSSRGDAAAFQMIYERHADYSLAYRMCGRRGLAEDVTQEAFLAPPEPFIER